LPAATPPVVALRTGLALASAWVNLEKDCLFGAVAGDAIQAFFHADVDEKIIARAPKDLGGVQVEHTGRRLNSKEGDWLDVVKALHGYRRSPKLWQLPFFKVTQNVKCLAFVFLSLSWRCAPM
jgi:hypothetical protein